MSDKNDPIDNNEALLKSLESIKALLAKSETKLSAARESLHQANQGTSMKKTEPEPEIPTLDEIVEAGQQIEIGLIDENDIPVLESIEEEAPVFTFGTEEDIDLAEAAMTITTPSLAFADDENDELEDIPVLGIEPVQENNHVAESESNSTDEEPEAAVVALPDLTPLLNAIDDAEGTMRAQISEAAINFEERLNSQLDVQMQKLREQLHMLADKFKK